jgi:hypothetical protein
MIGHRVRSFLCHILHLSSQEAIHADREMSRILTVQLLPSKPVTTGFDGAIVGTFALLIMDNAAHRNAPLGLVEDIASGGELARPMMSFALERCEGSRLL